MPHRESKRETLFLVQSFLSHILHRKDVTPTQFVCQIVVHRRANRRRATSSPHRQEREAHHQGGLVLVRACRSGANGIKPVGPKPRLWVQIFVLNRGEGRSGINIERGNPIACKELRTRRHTVTTKPIQRTCCVVGVSGSLS